MRRKDMETIMTNTTQSTGEMPSHRLYCVTGTGKSASWREIGAAWPNKDGKGFSLNCAAMPLQGRIVMRVALARKPTEQNG